MTLKRRAEISADIFARLLRYFFLSCKNLTITFNTGNVKGSDHCFIGDLGIMPTNTYLTN